MMNWLYIGIGGALGAICRYAVSLLCSNIRILSIPAGTFAVNILGCFILGIITGLGQRQNVIPPQLMLLASTGFCGAFTTFSTFSAETVKACEGGHILQAALYVAASITIGFLIFWLGKRIVS